jgi:hypothetical protein
LARRIDDPQPGATITERNSRPRSSQSLQHFLNRCIFDASVLGGAVVCDEERLSTIAQVPVVPERAVVLKGDRYANEIACDDFRWPCSSSNMISREFQKVLAKHFGVLESRADLESTDLRATNYRRARIIVPRSPAGSSPTQRLSP